MIRERHRFWPIAPVAVAVSVLAASCTATPQSPSASGDPAGTSMVIAIASEPASLNPLAGYAPFGAAKIFDGLLEHRADGSLRPALAATPPVPSPDGRSWTVALRRGVTFSNGTTFDAADVVATFRALLDPAYQSPLRERYAVLAGVTQLDPGTVRFDLTAPYAPFPQLLTLGMLPAEALATPVPVTRADPPVGTGPYRLTEWVHGQRLVLAANPTYYDGAPKVTSITVDVVPDDQARVARLRDGTLDGAELAPKLAHTVSATGMQVLDQDAADVRAVTMPAANPVTADPALRLALNLALDRKALLVSALDGKGAVASTPVPDTQAEFVEPGAVFTADQLAAARTLDAAGWTLGTDGTRARGGVSARFTVRYPVGDSLSRDLAVAFAQSARTVGVLVDPRGASAAEPAAADDAVLVGVGDPFDPDLSLYPLLRDAPGETGAQVRVGHTATDPAQRAVAYRAMQRAYLAAPTMVVLARTPHAYVVRQNWNGYQTVTDATGAGIAWGAWWNLQKWTPR